MPDNGSCQREHSAKLLRLPAFLSLGIVLQGLRRQPPPGLAAANTAQRDRNVSLFSSEHKPQAELQFAFGGLRIRRETEVGTADAATRRTESRMIQNVEELGAELHVQRFREMCVLQHGEVHVPPARTGIGIASEITGSRLHSPYACDSGRDCRDAEVVARVVDRIAREELRAMLRITIGPFDEIPTVIFCGSDLIAMGAMSALEDAGVKIPEDVSIVGIDDISFAFLAPATPYHDQRSS